VKVLPGYDGVYGELILFDEQQEKAPKKLEKIKQYSLSDFM
jgi:hypothetical protein